MGTLGCGAPWLAPFAVAHLGVVTASPRGHPRRRYLPDTSHFPAQRGLAPVERSRLSRYQPTKERFPRPSPETSLPLARSEAATLPGLLQGVEFAGRSGMRNFRPILRGSRRSGERCGLGTSPFEGDIGGLGRRRFAFIGSSLVDSASRGHAP